MGGFIGGSSAIRLGFQGKLFVARVPGARLRALLGVLLGTGVGFFGACASAPIGETSAPLEPPAPLGLAALEAPPSGTVAEEIRRLEEEPERPDRELRLAHLQLLARKPESAIAICYRLKYDHQEPIGPELEARADLYLARAYLALFDEERSRYFARRASEQTASSEVRAAALQIHRGVPEASRAKPRLPRPVPAPATAAPASILARGQWGGARPVEAQMGPMGRIQRVTVHHSGTQVASTTKNDAARVLRSIQQKHMETDHYADIGYHFLIDPAGRIWEGRAISRQGAHAGDNTSNRGNVGICLIGDFSGADRPSGEQMASLRSLVEFYLDRAGLDPSALVTHREIRPAHMGITECPGNRLQALVERMRADLRPRRTALGN